MCIHILAQSHVIFPFSIGPKPLLWLLQLLQLPLLLQPTAICRILAHPILHLSHALLQFLAHIVDALQFRCVADVQHATIEVLGVRELFGATRVLQFLEADAEDVGERLEFRCGNWESINI